MISIRKYWNTEGNSEGKSESVQAATDAQSPENLHTFASGVLGCINQFVLTGETANELRSRLLLVGESLRPALNSDEASQALASVSSVLASHHASAQRAGVEQTVEAQNVFGLLNQALVVLSEGNDRDLSRLATIQESLQRTASMRDLASLKTSLAETVQFVKAEFVQARETAAAELGRFESEVTSARKFLGGAGLELGGRAEGVTGISECLTNRVPGETLYVVAYLCNRLEAVVQRYGVGVADELISRLIKERLKPVMPKAMYRWTPSSLVGLFSRPGDAEKLRNEVTALNRGPLVHKMALGGRTAVLTISPSHLVAEGVSGSSATLVEQVDRFTRAAA